MSILGNDELKEQQKLKSLELAINREKAKVDKKLTRQKILLGAFMAELLETDKVPGLSQYTAKNLEDFLTRQGDKDLMSELINNLDKSSKQIY